MIAELLTVCSENFHVDSSLKTVHTVYILQTGTEFSKKKTTLHIINFGSSMQWGARRDLVL